jgi:hypothetical protein
MIVLVAQGGPKMVHTYEVLVDIKEYSGQSNSSHCETSRYEVDAESTQGANSTARAWARNEHPRGVEYDARVTRLLK